jgi:drug/metabolite transporter (DMT)-like permease
MKTTFSILGIISCTIAANILLKIGAAQPASERFVFGIVGWHGLTGFFFWGIAALLYAWVLQLLPLNVAQSLLAAQFIGVILASALVLGEPIDAMRWVGMGLIAAGIVVVGLSTR